MHADMRALFCLNSSTSLSDAMHQLLRASLCIELAQTACAAAPAAGAGPNRLPLGPHRTLTLPGLLCAPGDLRLPPAACAPSKHRGFRV